VVSRPLPAPDHRVGVNLVPDPGEPARLGFGEVVFLLADADCPVVRVPFRGFDPAATKRTTESFAAAHVRVLPVELDMGEAASGLELDTSLIVEALDPKQALQPTDFGGEPRDTFSLRAEPANEAKSLWRVAVHIKVGPPGFLVGAVYLRPRPNAERLRVPFVLHVVPVTEAYPGGVYVADREPHVVRIARGDRKPVKVASVRSSTPSIVAALVPDAGLLEPGAVAVRVAPAPGAPRGPVRGEVEVAVDDPAVPPVVLPVFGELP
jgi:hypothetical protein